MAIGQSDSTTLTDQTFANQMGYDYNENVATSEVNQAVRKYFDNQSNASYRGIDRIKNHYHNHWNRDTYFEKDHTFYCPCCFLVLFALSRGNNYYIDRFFEKFRGQNEFDWHYGVEWKEFDKTQYYSLEPYARLARLDSGGQIENYTEAGFAYYENGRQRVVNFHGAEAFYFTSSIYDENGVESIPSWFDSP